MNFKFADIYKKKDDVFKRKAIKLTKFLNELIVAIKQKVKTGDMDYMGKLPFTGGGKPPTFAPGS